MCCAWAVGHQDLSLVTAGWPQSPHTHPEEEEEEKEEEEEMDEEEMEEEEEWCSDSPSPARALDDGWPQSRPCSLGREKVGGVTP
jgi:hypothetical protein